MPRPLMEGETLPDLTEAETIADEWGRFIPLELTLERAKHVVNFVMEDSNEDDSTKTVLKFILKLMDVSTPPPTLPEQKQFRIALSRMRKIIYRKQGFQFFIAGHTADGAYVPELDVPCRTFKSVQNYIHNSPYMQQVSPQAPISEDDFGRTEDGALPLLTRIDGLEMMIWKL